MWIQDYILPACLALIPVLYLIGMLLKRSERFQDRFIPLTLGIIGIFLAVLTVLSAAPLPRSPREWLSAILAGVTQGILCAGSAVYGNQIVKQARKTEPDR